MLADSGASTVITESKYAEVLPGSTAQLVDIDKDSAQIAAASEQNGGGSEWLQPGVHHLHLRVNRAAQGRECGAACGNQTGAGRELCGAGP